MTDVGCLWSFQILLKFLRWTGTADYSLVTSRISYFIGTGTVSGLYPNQVQVFVTNPEFLRYILR